MLIGAHVSTAGGLVEDHGRGVEGGCKAIQRFNQSPRQWRPTRWKPDDVTAFLELMEGGRIESITIHAVYLINPATKDRDMRHKSAASLIHALRMGDEIGADGVVLHPGSTVGEPHDEALPRVGDMLRHALGESDSCRLLLENTAGAGNTLGRSFEELAELIDLAGAAKRIGICLDSCHMLASGFDIDTADKLTGVIDAYVRVVGLRRLRCLHHNASLAPPGSNRAPHPPARATRVDPRPPRAAGRRRAGRPRLRGVPVGAALREAAGAVRGPGRRGPRPRQAGRRPHEGAAPQRSAGAQAAPLADVHGGGEDLGRRASRVLLLRGALAEGDEHPQPASAKGPERIGLLPCTGTLDRRRISLAGSVDRRR